MLICTYCDHKRITRFYNKLSIKSERCAKCNDKHLKVKDLSYVKIDTYAGSPDFDEEKEIAKMLDNLVPEGFTFPDGYF